MEVFVFLVIMTLWGVSCLASVVLGMALMAGDIHDDLIERDFGQYCANGSFAYIGECE